MLQVCVHGVGDVLRGKRRACVMARPLRRLDCLMSEDSRLVLNQACLPGMCPPKS